MTIPLPIAFVAQESGSSSQVERARRGKFKSVALQNSRATDASVKSFRDAGFFVCEWDEVGATTKLHAGTQAFIPQVESPAQYDGAMAALKAGVGSGFPKLVITTYWGLYDPTNDTTIRSGSKWKALQALGVTDALVECYKADGAPHDNVAQMLYQGQVYGIDVAHLFAVVGTYRGEMPADYAGLKERTPNFGIYIIEQSSDAQLDAFAQLVPDAPAPPPAAPSPADLNAQIVQLCDSWLSRQTGVQARSRLRNIRRIAATTGNDPVWLAAQPGVTGALDQAQVP